MAGTPGVTSKAHPPPEKGESWRAEQGQPHRLSPKSGGHYPTSLAKELPKSRLWGHFILFKNNNFQTLSSRDQGDPRTFKTCPGLAVPHLQPPIHMWEEGGLGTTAPSHSAQMITEEKEGKHTGPDGFFLLKIRSFTWRDEE